MKIDKYQHFYGAALIQIVEDSRSPVVQAMKLKGRRVVDAFQVNEDACICFKYASGPGRKSSWGDYSFNLSRQLLADLGRVESAGKRVWLGLICVAGKEICCLPYSQLLSIIEERRPYMQVHYPERCDEDNYIIGVDMQPGRYLRVGISAPWKVKKAAITEYKIPRNAFPSAILRD